jgi:hypothetical protein
MSLKNGKHGSLYALGICIHNAISKLSVVSLISREICRAVSEKS